MAITRIDDPPFIQRQDISGWEKGDTGKRVWGLFKGYNTDTISAAQLGLKTIHGALVSKMTIDKVLEIQGSVTKRGSKANSMFISMASGATAYGTFALFYTDAWGF